MLSRSLAATLGGAWSVQSLHASGFCATWRAQSRGQDLFVKSLPLGQSDVLEAEADGLAALALAIHPDAPIAPPTSGLELCAPKPGASISPA